jgi:hypothetical protein
VTVVAAIMMVVGLFLCVQNCGEMENTQTALAVPGLSIDRLLLYIINRIYIWWHHE